MKAASTSIADCEWVGCECRNAQWNLRGLPVIHCQCCQVRLQGQLGNRKCVTPWNHTKGWKVGRGLFRRNSRSTLLLLLLLVRMYVLYICMCYIYCYFSYLWGESEHSDLSDTYQITMCYHNNNTDGDDDRTTNLSIYLFSENFLTVSQIYSPSLIC